jgi:hypothetical protein
MWTDKGLVIVFNDESTYVYPDVSYETYTKFLGARSHGGYFNDNIKGQYRYDKLSRIPK